MEAIISIVAVILSLAVFMLATAKEFTHGDELISKWADENKFVIIEKERRKFRTGPFFLHNFDKLPIYYVTLRDDKGAIRYCYIKCSGWSMGFKPNEFSVIWDRSRETTQK